MTAQTKIALAGIKLSALVLLLASSLHAQDLSARLSQSASYQPKATTTLQQLIEVAQHYRIPMGIEWIHETKTEDAPLPETTKPRTVNDLIAAILNHSPGYIAQQRDNVLHIVKTEFMDKRENFLNLRLPTFELENENIFGAEYWLRLRIKMKLHPERYKNGYGGGYGYGAGTDDGFDKENITLAGNDLTVREILNKIVIANGNALWVVQFSPSEKMASEPFRAQVSMADNQTLPDNFHCEFIALGKSPLQ